MGPTNVALVKLFRAEQQLREAQGRLDAATKNVRIQERKVADLAEKVKLAQNRHKELQARGASFELDIKTREARIEKLRLQQQNTHNNKEYQAFLMEISTEKVDRGKSEDELLKVMEQQEKSGAELKEATALHDSENQKLATLRGQINETVEKLKQEVEALRPARDAAAAAVPAKLLQSFERLAERYDGEALSALSKPDRRREEYLCTACHMELVVNVYNRLHTRDDVVACTSCGRYLFIPEDLPPEVAINSRGKFESASSSATPSTPKPRRTKSVEKLDPSERRAKGKVGEVLAAAQGESVKIALDAGLKPMECEVILDGKPQGTYKGKNGEHLQRIIGLRLEEAGMKRTVQVREKAVEPPAAPEGEATAAAPDLPAAPPSPAPAVEAHPAAAPTAGVEGTTTPGVEAAPAAEPSALEQPATPQTADERSAAEPSETVA